ncbi:MAG: NnrU family protein [Pseudomonadota bacterium]
MTLLIVGLLSWWIVHLFPIFARPARNRLAGAIGEGPYKGAYALVTVGTVVLMVLGYQSAPFTNLWYPPPFLSHINNVLMLLAITVFIAGGIPSPVRRWIRHPQFTGLKIWAAAHLLVNGDLASVILFGGLLAWAVVAMIGTNKRDGKDREMPARTKLGTPIHILASLAIYYLVVMIHNWAGVWPLPGTAPGT